ncbi:MAG: hypothetical protein NVSMB39_4530 [Candidatus Saccharimonadales bacterium]
MSTTPEQKSRINAFDLLRGWCLIVISSDHLMLFPSIFDPVTGRGLLWVTAAEGFFFISGALVGIVRGHKMQAEGLRSATRLLWARAGKLYIASVILTLLFTGLAYGLQGEGFEGLKGGLGSFASARDLLWATLSLQYSYGWTDFLNYYVVFLLLSPAALWLCRRGWWWSVLAGALAVWLSKTYVHNEVLLGYLTWQSYFFFGLIFGYRYQDIRGAYRRLSDGARSNLWRLLYAATAVTVLASFAFTFGTPMFEHRNAGLYEFFRSAKDNAVFTLLLQNNRTGLLRLPLFLLWFGTLFAVVRRYEPAILKRVGWLLLPLGKNSLYVYIVAGILIFLVTLAEVPQNFVLNSLINLGAIGVYWWAVRRRILFKVIPR